MSLLLILAALPCVGIVIYIYCKDKEEKEPIGLILKLIGFGILSCIAAIVLETIMELILPKFEEGTFGYAFTISFFVAALCEEFVKYWALRLGSWRNKNFDYRFDGLIYGVSAAIGFALLENIEYVIQGGISTAIIRAITAVPLHSMCGLYMGIFYAYQKKAALSNHRKYYIKAGLLAYFVPFLIHGVYDTLAFMRQPITQLLLFAMVLVMVIISIIVINKFSREDGKYGFYTKPTPPQSLLSSMTVLRQEGNKLLGQIPTAGSYPGLRICHALINENPANTINISLAPQNAVSHTWNGQEFISKFSDINTLITPFETRNIDGQWALQMSENGHIYWILGLASRDVVQIKKL